MDPDPIARLSQGILRVTGAGFDHAEHGTFRIGEHRLFAALRHFLRRSQHPPAAL